MVGCPGAAGPAPASALIVVALAARVIPVQRVARLDPADGLRDE
jgi:hypothetical protein